MKVQDLIDNSRSIIENGVENRAQFDEAMSLYGDLVREASRRRECLVRGEGTFHQARKFEPAVVPPGCRQGTVPGT